MQLIPRVFHQIWLGSDACPEEFVRYRQTWIDLNPGWELAFWTEENLPDNVRPEIHERLRFPAERSDLLRLELLFRFGGVYIDTDFECLRPIEGLIGEADFFVGELKPGRLNNAIIGSVPQHQILEHAIREAAPRSFHGYSKAATGPLLLDRIVSEYPGTKRFPPPVFYPQTPDALTTATARHHSARSWRSDDSFRAIAVLAEKRLFTAEERLLDAIQTIERLRRRSEAAAIREELEELSSRLDPRRELRWRQTRDAGILSRIRRGPKGLGNRARNVLDRALSAINLKSP